MALSQGTVGFGNYLTGNGSYLYISYGLTRLGGSVGGPPPTTANFALEMGNGNDWTVALYGAPLGGTPVQLYDASGLPLQARLAEGMPVDYNPGTWVSSDIGLIPGTVTGGSGIVQLCAWYNEGGVLSNYTAALNAVVPTGFSAVATVNDLGGPQNGVSPPPAQLPIGELGNFSLRTFRFTTGALSGAAFLDPLAFESLGVFNPATNIVVDVSSKQMSGGATFIGTDVTQAGVPLLVFTFSSFTLNSGLSITFTNYTGGSGVAFLSQSDMTIGGVITASGQFGGGAGIGGYGTGGEGGGGGGFGGSGGDGSESADGYGVGGGTNSLDITSGLAGGSCGGTGAPNPTAGAPGGLGGFGGGAVQLAANGSLIVTGSILVNGSDGQGPPGYYHSPSVNYLPSWGAGGGGSGGGILMQAGKVDIKSTGVISVDGGAGGPAANPPVSTPTYLIFGTQNPGGGGGGGCIVITWLDSGSASGWIHAFGGSAGVPAGFGETGTVIFEKNLLVPAFPSIATSLVSSGDFVLSWPSSATNYLFQTSPALGAGAVWKTVTGPVVVGNTFVLTNQAQGTAGFFRLMNQ